MHLSIRTGLALALTLLASTTWAQPAPPKTTTPKTAPKAETKTESKAEPKAEVKTEPKVETNQPAKPVAPATPSDEYNALQERMKTIIDDLRKLKLKYAVTQGAEKAALEKQFDALLGEGNTLFPKLRDAGKKAYEAAPNADPQLTRFLVKMAIDDAMNDHYRSALDVADLLIKNDCDEKQIYVAAGVAAFSLDEFQKATDYFAKAKAAGITLPTEVNYADDAKKYEEFWAEEQKIREAEAKADDLPRVKLETSQGDIVIELFENEAPDTVGNFISLVEKGHYDGTKFHRVLRGFMAQGGDPKGDGTGGPGYQIYCEIGKNYRKHFAGSLSMAHAGKDTGGSQFFLTFRATPHLNGVHTCFGRVISGMDVLEKLHRGDPMNPGKGDFDKIIKATVVRKRDHAYVPNKAS
ncbi:peptidylprolyl isomerase [Anatilimnocola floriformis]|uniref:peptidylprolyl isomerase n=1 Tax=Anatilimnocola floriformis TaxID=2948575 RepID=UPI0020C57AB4|nr:peptidylprolyl isomerase [Anatilimnocola floriformis]